MRYYEIVINPIGAGAFEPIIYSTLGGFGDNYSALQVDLDIYQTQSHQPSPLGSINIYGVPFEDLNSSANLVGAFVEVYLGMTPGYDIVTPRIGLAVKGTVLQSFGNWQGNNVCLSLIITMANINPANDINLTFNWKPGQPLDEAVTLTLQNAYNGVPVTGNYSPDLVFTEVQSAWFPNLQSFSEWLNTISRSINLDPAYLGATIIPTSTGFNLLDGTTSSEVTLINYTDLIGNITWINQATISVKVVMRPDLEVGQYITFPLYAPIVNTTSFSPNRNSVAFQGIFSISQIRHQGSSRQTDANSWVTVIEARIPGQTLLYPTITNF